MEEEIEEVGFSKSDALEGHERSVWMVDPESYA